MTVDLWPHAHEHTATGTWTYSTQVQRRKENEKVVSSDVASSIDSTRLRHLLAETTMALKDGETRRSLVNFRGCHSIHLNIFKPWCQLI